MPEKDLRLRKKPAREIARLQNRRSAICWCLTLDGEGVSGTVIPAQSQRKARNDRQLGIGKLPQASMVLRPRYVVRGY